MHFRTDISIPDFSKRMKRSLPALLVVAIVVIVVLAFLFRPPPAVAPREVVVYTSVDQVYSEPVLKAYEKTTGVSVRVVYDVEAAKTTGLVQRLISERANPRADLFWNGEIMQTLLLKEQGVLAPYSSPSASGIPPVFIDPDGYWTGFGGRCRVILVNTDLLAPDRYPTSVDDFVNGSVPGVQTGIAYPLFGTTATHAAALYAARGDRSAREYFVALRERGVRVLDGNAVVRDQVASGLLACGLTDSDDACGAVQKGSPVRIVIPDQGPGGQGTLVIPNTVALVRGGPNPAEGKRLIDHLLSPGTEAGLVGDGWFQMTTRGTSISPCLNATTVVPMNVSYARVAAIQEDVKKDLAEIFIR
jgi:iron(III) transport system substrate-binding protein